MHNIKKKKEKKSKRVEIDLIDFPPPLLPLNCSSAIESDFHT